VNGFRGFVGDLRHSQTGEAMQAKTRRMPLFAVVAVALGVILGGTVLAQSDSNLGTWMLNVPKSKFEPGPPPMSLTRVTEVWDTNGIKTTATVVAADGTRATSSFSAHYDGKDYKVTGVPGIDTIALTRVNANTIAFTIKTGGKVVETAKLVVSKNGKMHTLTATGTSAKGETVHNMEVFEKQ
jgi:hypothetical protein